MSIGRWGASTALGLTLAALAQGAWAADAADADAATVGEVVVTAEFVKADLQKTAVAISVITPDTLELKAVETVADIVNRIPGLAAPTSLQHSQTSYYIRGIGESDSIANQTVGTYVDDVYISRPIGGTFELNDVESIQVLRGPQGTLYGRNSSAGAIKVTTKLPDNDFHAFFEAGAGNYDANIVRLGVSGPIIQDKLAASVSYVRRQQRGFVYDVTLQQWVGDIDTDSIRVKFNYTPTEKLSLLFSGDYFLDNGDPTPKQTRLQPGGVINEKLNYSEVLISNHTKLGGASVRALYQANDALTLKSVTSFRAFTQPGYYDQDGSAAAINRTFSDHRDENFSQDLQAIYETEKLNVVGGLFYLFDNFRSYRTGYNPGANGNLLPYISERLPARTTLQDSKEKTKNYSAYAQGSYRVLPTVKLTAGARYTIERHNFTFQGNEQNEAKQYLPNFYYLTRPYKTWKSFTPKVGADWEVTDRIMTYVTWSKGFKAGGFDGRATTKAAAGLAYDPEKVTALEGGVKADFFERRLRTNLALFHNDINGYQASALDENNLSHRINLGKVKTKGAEFEATLVPFSGLTLQYNLTYLDSEVIEAGGAVSNTAAYVGKAGPNAPKWSHFVSADYVFPQNRLGEFRIGGEFIKRSKYYTDLTNIAGSAAEGQKLVNLSASFQPEAASHWRVSLAVLNLLNDRFDTGGARGNGITTSNATTYTPPRTWFVRLRYAY